MYEVRNKEMEVNQSNLPMIKFRIERHVFLFLVFFSIRMRSDKLFSRSTIGDYAELHQGNSRNRTYLNTLILVTIAEK
jgi:hypothetical protein